MLATSRKALKLELSPYEVNDMILSNDMNEVCLDMKEVCLILVELSVTKRMFTCGRLAGHNCRLQFLQSWEVVVLTQFRMNSHEIVYSVFGPASMGRK